MGWTPPPPAPGTPGSNLLTFCKVGSVNVAQLLSIPTEAAAASTFPMGHFMPEAKTLSGIWLLTGSSTAAAAGTLNVEIRYTTPGAGAASPHTLGTGTLIGNVQLIAAGALGALYYRQASNIVAAGSIPAGALLFAEIQAVGFWNLTDVFVTARVA